MKALTFLLIGAFVFPKSVIAADPLPSWKDTAPKKAITLFVEKVTKEGSPDFVPVPERIAVFDNDGTLWCEQPMYFQAFLPLRPSHRRRARMGLRPHVPHWQTRQGPRRGSQQRLGGGGHGEGLDADLPLIHLNSPLSPMLPILTRTHRVNAGPGKNFVVIMKDGKIYKNTLK